MPRYIDPPPEPELPDNDEVMRAVSSLRGELFELSQKVGKLTSRVDELEGRIEELDYEK